MTIYGSESATLEGLLRTVVMADTFLDTQAQARGPPEAEAFELFISPFPTHVTDPFPQNGLFALFEEREKALDIAKLSADYRKVYPPPERSQFKPQPGSGISQYDAEENYLTAFGRWFSRYSTELDSQTEARKRHAESIDNLLLAGKQEIFGHLALEFRALMLKLRIISLFDMTLAAYSLRKETQMTHPDIKNQSMQTNLSAHLTRIQRLAEHYLSSAAPGEGNLEKVAEDAEVLATALHPYTSFDSAFIHSDSPGAELTPFRSGEFFKGFDRFLLAFDWNVSTSEPRFVSFKSDYFPLNGSYLLVRSSRFKFTELNYPDETVARTFSPIRFRIELPQRYAPVVRQTFDRLAKEFGERVIPASQLRAS